MTHSSETVFERDQHGTVYAVELVDADSWNQAFIEPDAAIDVRVVRFAGDDSPDDLPPWIGLEAAGQPSMTPSERRPASVADPVGEYEVGAPPHAARWQASPSYREPGARLDDFIAAGIEVARYPLQAPTNERRRIEMLRAFTESCDAPLRHFGALDGDQAERWLRVTLDEPESFAEALAIERIRLDGAIEVSEALSFVASAPVPDSPAYRELAIDRQVLREQASPWRYLAGEPFAGALSAVQAWRRRYQLAYEAHYRSVGQEATRLIDTLDRSQPACGALQRLNGISALGRPAGVASLAAHRRARQALDDIPEAASPDAARTANVPLGGEPLAFVAARAAIEAVDAAIETQRRRLAARAMHFVLDRETVPALDRLLQAIAASDVGGIERALDDRLAAHIERMLSTVDDSPLAEFAGRFPVVTEATLDQAIDSFRALLEAAIGASTTGQAVLREDRPGAVA